MPLPIRPLTHLATPLAALALLTGCTGGDARDEDPPVAATSAASPSSPPATSATPTAAAPSPTPEPTLTGTAARAVYYLADTGPGGPRLYREFHRRPATTAVVRDAVTAMIEQRPRDDDYTSLWPRRTTVRGVRVDGAAATVDLSSEARTANAGAAAEAASLQQLVYTVTAAAPQVKTVQLLVEGRVVPDLWGHSDTRRPMRREMAAATLGPVWITSPDGGSVRRGGRFGGEASVFEATVSWELVRAGTVVKKGFTNAAEGAPGRGAWSAVADVAPGRYVLRAFESSAEDGRPIFVDDKPLTVI